MESVLSFILRDRLGFIRLIGDGKREAANLPAGGWGATNFRAEDQHLYFDIGLSGEDLVPAVLENIWVPMVKFQELSGINLVRAQVVRANLHLARLGTFIYHCNHVSWWGNQTAGGGKDLVEQLDDGAALTIRDIREDGNSWRVTADWHKHVRLNLILPLLNSEVLATLKTDVDLRNKIVRAMGDVIEINKKLYVVIATLQIVGDFRESLMKACGLPLELIEELVCVRRLVIEVGPMLEQSVSQVYACAFSIRQSIVWKRLAGEKARVSVIGNLLDENHARCASIFDL